MALIAGCPVGARASRHSRIPRSALRQPYLRYDGEHFFSVSFLKKNNCVLPHTSRIPTTRFPYPYRESRRVVFVTIDSTVAYKKSFGVSVSDIVTAISLAKDTVQFFRHAPNDFAEESKVSQSLPSYPRRSEDGVLEP